MVNLNVNLNGADYVLSLPTMFSEVNPEFLKTLVDNVDVAPNYSLVAIVCKEKPITIISSIKRSKNATVSGVAMMIKHGESDSNFINNSKTGETLNVAASDIALGYHVSAAYNSLNANFLASLVNDNTSLYNQCMAIKEAVYFVDFKIIPNCNIHGIVKTLNKPVVDIYFKKVKADA